jgi:metal-dependent amidase/aminoacylase/carboxypeptidase family protein
MGSPRTMTTRVERLMLSVPQTEEIDDGAAECVTFIQQNDIDEILAFHDGSGFPLGSVNVIDGTCNCASTGMIIHMEVHRLTRVSLRKEPIPPTL